MLRHLPAAALLALALAACTEPYRTPVVSSGGPILGVADHFEGPDPSVRMILTHGMCSDSHRGVDADPKRGQANWVARRAGQIAAALGATDTTIRARRHDYPTGIERYDVEIPGPRGTVEATFLIWGRLVDPHRDALEFENTRRDDDPEAPIRALVNAGLKRELMNRCLIDAVVYLGAQGDAIRRGMREAVCDTLGGTFRPAASPGRPGTRATCAGVSASGKPTVLVPESLGSAVLLDALTDLSDGGGSVAGAVRQDIRSVFLASHQIPLLAQANAPPDAVIRATGGRAEAGDPLSRFLGALDDGQRTFSAAPLRPIQIVSITDPNDLLGYRLDLERFEHVSFEPRNVLVSNAGAFLGVVANPIDAHSNTARPEVFEIIANGLPAP